MSTDLQQYSMPNQAALIESYAHKNAMSIVRSYVDPGRSGLTLKHRPGLSRLLSDVLSGEVNFTAILVYDVSRWGRFQDADEGGHYEFLCRQAGIQIIYCAEPFLGEATAFDSLLKALKRAMASEYSRELGVRVAAGKALIGGLGFRIGGIAGYGLRRQVLENGTRPGIVLEKGQHKCIHTDRVRLVPGPREELVIVRRVYRDYIYLRKSERQICADLNAEGLTCFGRPWSRHWVRSILGNEKYMGTSIVGQFSRRLRGPQIINPPEKWLRHEGAFEPIVSRELFAAASCVRRYNQVTQLASDQIVVALRLVLEREGRLTARIVDAAAELPSASTVELRFGTLSHAYEVAGYRLSGRYAFHSVNRALKALGRSTQLELIEALDALGVACRREEAGVIVMAGGARVQVLACRFRRSRTSDEGWRIRWARNDDLSAHVALLMDAENECVARYLLLPQATLERFPTFVARKDIALLGPYTHLDGRSVASALARESFASGG